MLLPVIGPLFQLTKSEIHWQVLTADKAMRMLQQVLGTSHVSQVLANRCSCVSQVGNA